MQKSINGAMLRKMILNGAKLLDINKTHVDSLNVFPVPDGDTGTNMSLTMFSAAKKFPLAPAIILTRYAELWQKARLGAQEETAA